MAPSQPTLKLAGVLTTDEEWAAALVPDEKGSLSVIESYAGWCGPSDAATSTLTMLRPTAHAHAAAGAAGPQVELLRRGIITRIQRQRTGVR